MNQADFRIERILHAYIDGELGSQEKSRLLVLLENDEGVRRRACELQRIKEWIKCSFEGESAPTRTLPGVQWRLRHTSPFRIAASLLIIMIAFVAGWAGNSLKHDAARLLALDTVNSGAPHVILHISEANEARFDRVLERTEQILHRYGSTDVQVEVVANSGGLDFMRTASSHHIDSIKRIISRHNNVHFIACARGLDKLRSLGQDATVVEGVNTDAAAADHLIERLTEGWTYIRI